MTDTPTFIGQMTSWAGAATAWATLLFNNRKSTDDGPRAVLVDFRDASLGVEIVIENVGARAVTDVTVRLDGITIGFTGGVSPKSTWTTVAEAPVASTGVVEVDAAGLRGKPEILTYAVFRTSTGWRIER